MIGALLAVGGIACLAYGAWNLRPAYHVYRGETDDVVSVERVDGPVELEGTATELAGTVEAPLTGTPCLAYEYEVEEHQSSGKNSSWNTVDSGSAAVPFRLEDETASVRVEPAGADFALTTDERIDVDGGEPEPEPVRRFLETESDLESENRSLDLAVVEIATGNDRRYYERRLDPGGEVYVLGQTTYDVEARETMRDISAVVEDGPESPVFVVADTCQDGAARLLARRGLVWFGFGLALLAFGVVSVL
ncbi:GIDE domain-containing protein [Halopiger goleimassiliensis]|uniref:GIDE domain-containing protein n=1 Tax=Halopiger goleimassiliensis TaxID=1293048 RepID=UPI0006779F1C|nr:GIDE domain-containing protein [Halopiger goleimassiliensis]